MRAGDVLFCSTVLPVAFISCLLVAELGGAQEQAEDETRSEARVFRRAVVLRDERPHERAVLLLRAEPLLLTLRHQRRIADDVGEHDRRELAFGGAGTHLSRDQNPPGSRGQFRGH